MPFSEAIERFFFIVFLSKLKNLLLLFHVCHHHVNIIVFVQYQPDYVHKYLPLQYNLTKPDWLRGKDRQRCQTVVLNEKECSIVQGSDREL